MATTLTRSSRSEGFSTRSNPHGASIARQPVIHNNNNAHNRQQPPNIGRKKRVRQEDYSVSEQRDIKKPKFAIEIYPQASTKAEHAIYTNEEPQLSAPLKVSQPQRTASPPPTLPPTIPKTTHDLPIRERSQKLHRGKGKTVHQKKVANGLQHELDRLQPRHADVNKDEKRKLRSQEGTRFKSELSAYFPEYDEVIGNEARESRKCYANRLWKCKIADLGVDILNLDTPITLYDSAKHPKSYHPKTYSEYAVRDFPTSLYDDLHDAKRVDFSFLDQNYKEEGGLDPLSDEYLVQIHKKPERLEKTIRNSDKGRAQHEKDQVARLLEGLQGHDWLKLMGVSGVTESKKREFEPARLHFVNGCETILGKFKSWKDEEKRRRLEKEQALADAEEEEEPEIEDSVDDELESIERDEVDSYESDGDPPDYLAIDAMAARQIQEEARAHVKKPPQIKYVPPPLEKDFTSFFSKRHVRDAALNKHRRSGRGVAAFGQPIPEPQEQDFDLPEEYRDEETLKSRMRARRRARRVVKSQ